MEPKHEHVVEFAFTILLAAVVSFLLALVTDFSFPDNYQNLLLALILWKVITNAPTPQEETTAS